MQEIDMWGKLSFRLPFLGLAAAGVFAAMGLATFFPPSALGLLALTTFFTPVKCHKC
jgi:hypothetical protein